MTPILKTQVVQEPESAKIYDANDNPIRIIGTSKLYVHVSEMTELANFLVPERLAVQAILGC